jgi:diguanylate cyclase (GGDEF)-like protein
LDIQEKKNKKLLFIDNIAGIHDKYFFFESGMTILQLAKRNKAPISMAIIDIDDLKKLNEEYSYEISNKIIQSVAQTLKNKCRKSDLVAYFGDGRFGLLLYDISGINTSILLDSIRKKIEYNKYKVKEKVFNITVSIGASVINILGGKEDSLEDIYDKAYLVTNIAKEKGKNRVVVY